MTRQERKERWMREQNEKALPEFMGVIIEIQERLCELSDYFDDHMGLDPESVTFGHVNTAAFYLGELSELTDKIYKRGEYAR